MLHLPEESCFPLITVVLGYAREEPEFKKGRLGREYIVHYDYYQPPGPAKLDAIVAEYEDPDKHIGLKNAWNKKQFKTYLEWYYTRWEGIPDGKKEVSGKIKEFQDRLVKSGFWWE